MNYFNQESERLRYRALTEKDIESWIEFFENNDSLQFLGIDISKNYREIATEWILKQLERYSNQGLGHLAVIEKSTDKLIGLGGIIPRELGDKTEYEIAYSLKPNYWNKGYGTEVAQQIKAFGKQQNIASTFISIIHKNNIASINVAKKNKMAVDYETEFLGMPVYVFRELL